MSTVIVLGLLWLGIELAATAFAEDLLQRRVESRVSGIAESDVSIDSFPLATRLATERPVERTTVTLRGVERAGVTFDRVVVRLNDLEVDRGPLIRGRFRATDLGSGSITAIASLDEIAEEAGAASELISDPATIEVSGGQLVFAVGGVGEIGIDLPVEVLPCDPAASVANRKVVLSCSVNAIPELLKRVYGG